MENFLTKEEVFDRYKNAEALISDSTLSNKQRERYYSFFVERKNLESQKLQEEHQREMVRRDLQENERRRTFEKKVQLIEDKRQEEIKLHKAIKDLEEALKGGLLTPEFLINNNIDIEFVIKEKGWTRVLLDDNNKYREAIATFKANTSNKGLKHLHAYDEEGNVIHPDEAITKTKYYKDQFKTIPLHLVIKKGVRTHFAISCTESFMNSQYYDRYKESESESPLHKALKFELLRTQCLDIYGELYEFDKEEIKQEYYYNIKGKPVRFDMAVVKKGESKPYIAIEFAVTHPVDKVKRKAILEADILLIEKDYNTTDKKILTNENYIEKEILKGIVINGERYDPEYGFRADIVRDEKNRVEELNREVEKYNQKRRDAEEARRDENQRVKGIRKIIIREPEEKEKYNREIRSARKRIHNIYLRIKERRESIAKYRQEEREYSESGKDEQSLSERNRFLMSELNKFGPVGERITDFLRVGEQAKRNDEELSRSIEQFENIRAENSESRKTIDAMEKDLESYRNKFGGGQESLGRAKEISKLIDKTRQGDYQLREKRERINRKETELLEREYNFIKQEIGNGNEHLGVGFREIENRREQIQNLKGRIQNGIKHMKSLLRTHEFEKLLSKIDLNSN
ncbi:hypothetical protein [Flammeovirga sp. SJP92]|uniref:hypothetical protein n=1 Tax=Flammeovirga sp. SJP92 TaxID=1775430 RepID=UPI00078793AB|nr:hypothetical protein [Flammeovirga sp. SJP92]KXX67402.1 hypothetical protein AVL50_26900 [Flammeovirga sp. SJP92]